MRNTATIAKQHGKALEEVHERMIAYAKLLPSWSRVIHELGNMDVDMTKLEDED